LHLFLLGGGYVGEPFMEAMKPSGETETGDSQKPLEVVSESDIFFHCPACRGELVVDRAGIGLTCDCPHCGHALVVPDRVSEPNAALKPSPSPVSGGATVQEPSFDFSSHSTEQIERRLNELKHQLKENHSQDTEMRGHINRATIELHRLQLRLKKLQERRAEIEAESMVARTQYEARGSA
jgi:hypothetical protein